MSSATLPDSCRALVCTELGKSLTIETRPIPEALPGSVVVRFLAGIVDASFKAGLAGKIDYLNIATPAVLGSRAVCRIAAIGPDTTAFSLGQLVICEPTVRARDDHDTQILWGLGVFGFDAGELKLASGPWRDGLYADYARAPLENTHALDERRLMGSPADGGLGYSSADLTYITRFAVCYGGFRAINLQAGQTVIIAPATGLYSSAAVEVAIAMGARVIAVGRNMEKLKKVASYSPRVSIYQLKNDPAVDIPALKAFGTIDAFMDVSPGVAEESTHVASCMMAVKKFGKVVLEGVLSKDIPIPYMMAVLNSLTIKGQYMYEREDFIALIKMVETGVLKLGKEASHEIVGQFGLEEFAEAVDLAAENQAPGQFVVLAP